MELQQVLSGTGARVTRPRRAVWDVLGGVDGHLSAQEIADRVRRRDPGVNVSSVYRALTLFAELGLVRESRLGDDGASSWEISHEDAVIHLICTDCGVVVHHDAELVDRLRDQLARGAGFAASGIDVRVTGRCRSCGPATEPA